MNSPSLKERQEFWTWAYAHVSFEYVVEACAFISVPPKPLANAVWRILFSGIVTTYARPFTNCRGTKPLPANIVPKERLAFHKAIIDLRDKEIAHVDAKTYEAADP